VGWGGVCSVGLLLARGRGSVAAGFLFLFLDLVLVFCGVVVFGVVVGVVWGCFVQVFVSFWLVGFLSCVLWLGVLELFGCVLGFVWVLFLWFCFFAFLLRGFFSGVCVVFCFVLWCVFGCLSVCGFQVLGFMSFGFFWFCLVVISALAVFGWLSLGELVRCSCRVFFFFFLVVGVYCFVCFGGVDFCGLVGFFSFRV